MAKRSIITKLEAFNKHLEERLNRKQALAAKMRAENDFRKSMGYFMAFFSSK